MSPLLIWVWVNIKWEMIRNVNHGKTSCSINGVHIKAFWMLNSVCLSSALPICFCFLVRTALFYVYVNEWHTSQKPFWFCQFFSSFKRSFPASDWCLLAKQTLINSLQGSFPSTVFGCIICSLAVDVAFLQVSHNYHQGYRGYKKPTLQQKHCLYNVNTLSLH